MRYKINFNKIKRNMTGDTIVEVLLAMAIASFTIGIAYATAQRSLQQSITAKERNEALNIIENQLADLKLRFHNTPEANYAQFAYPNTHYCLEDTASDPAAANWGPIHNDSTVSESSPLQSNTPPNASNPYHTSCVQGIYHTDIVTDGSTATENPTLYRIIVRWEPNHGTQTNQASVYYKLNGGTGLSLGGVGVGGGPPPPPPAQVTFYADPGYGGASWSFPPGTDCDWVPVCGTGIPNDTISSIKVVGTTVAIYRDSYSGGCKTITGDEPDLSAYPLAGGLNGGTWSDNISSFKVGATCPPGPDVSLNIDAVIQAHPDLSKRPGLKVFADGVKIYDHIFTDGELTNICSGNSYSTAQPPFNWNTFANGEVCQPVSLNFTVSNPNTVSLEFYNDEFGSNKDNNIVINKVTTSSGTVQFNTYSASAAQAGFLPVPPGGAQLPPWSLWMLSDGTSTFNVAP